MSPSKLTKYCACHTKWPPNIWQKFAENSWNVISNARPIRDRSENDPTMIREWTRQSATRRATEVTFRAPDEHFVLKNTTFRAPAIFPNFTKYCACHEKWHLTFTKYCACHEKWHLTFTKYCACHEKLHLTCTKYCACHTEWLACLILVTYETSFPMRGATNVTLQTHQILRLPRTMTIQHLTEICWKQLKRHFQCAADPTMIRPWSDHDPRPFPSVRNPPRNRGYRSRSGRAFCIEKYNISRSGYLSKFHQVLRLPRKVTLDLHQVLRLSRKVHLTFTKYCACHEKWHLTFTKYCPCQEKCHLTFTKYCACHEKWHLTFTKYCTCHEKLHLTCTKYCACHTEWLACLILVTYETSFPMRGATNVTLQTHQILRLPRKMTIQHLTEICWKQLKRHFQCAADPTMIRPWSENEPVSPQPAAQQSLPFALRTSILYWKIQHVALRLSFQISPSTAPATKSDTGPSPSIAPATKSDTWPSPSTAPATKSDTWPSPSTAPATKSDTWQTKFCACHEKWHACLNLVTYDYLTLLLLNDSITWLHYYETIPLLDSTIAKRFYYLTLLLLNDSITWLYYYKAILLYYC